MRFRERFSIPITLRWSLTLWTAGLVLFLGLGLTVFTNVITSIRIPRVLTVDLVPTQLPLSGQITPDHSSQDPAADSNGHPAIVEQFQELAIREVRLITIVEIIIFSIIGAIGAFWISRQALQPLRHLNHLVSEIEPGTLNQRLSLSRREDEIKQLADAFDDMLERLERAFGQQGRFVADAAHELRTPLANMRTNLEVIQADPNATRSDYKNLSKTFNRSLARLEGLVEDLLLLAKGEQAINKEPVSLEDLLNKVIQETEPLSQKHQVEVKLGTTGNHIIAVDGPLLSIAFRNLIVNGIQYNRAGGQVTGTVRVEEETAIIEVIDTGIGIQKHDLPHIFERFYRVDKSQSQYLGGAGLGLSITAHIVELHGGSIEAESEPEAGSCFTIRLPYQEYTSNS